MLGMVSRCWPAHQTLCNLLTLLGQEASNSVLTVSKSGVSISHSPLALLDVNPTGFQSQAFWGLPFLVQDPQAG